ncbi:tetratricopeptide repeat protein 5 isoform X1 [Bufo bufo]|uniref:tetratricopeptide repeat protein 5 isoform X1 n=2 Tax=Bufo bufo TaxID=8384 RepID=UPI001ABEAAE3|nr:tetratricopeptide repeat protein 5 isoform X1 [Bufo bufo]
MAEGGAETEAEVRDRVQELVEKLFHFRDHYFETHSVEDAIRKQFDVKEEMKRTIALMDETDDAWKNKAFFLMLKGKALNVTPSYCLEAEEMLSKAVKLDPGLVEAWNQLGEVYWKKMDVTAAKTCFLGALNHCKNKVSLRNLSMVMRQQRAQDADENSQNIMDSVKQAKQAVQMDTRDGTSWYILGNAYLSLFFCTGQNPKISQQALNAYVQAERVDKTASSNPDLHLNRATLCKYEENYQGALDGFSRAAALEPSWTEPVMREEQLLDYLGRLCGLLSNKGKIRGKRLQNMLSSLSPGLLGHYGSSGGLQLKPLSALQPGKNPGCVVLGRVVFSLVPEERVPFTFGLVDTEGTCYAIMVYNMVESWGVLIADSVTIPEPHLKQHTIQHKGQTSAFESIRVDSPVRLLVNGKPQGPSTQASATVAYRPQSE